jgi:aminopeptidase N
MAITDARLPTHVVPLRYELVLEPDLPSGTFRGSVAIDVELLSATDEIVCNAADLEIDHVRLVVEDPGDGGTGAEHRPDVRLDPDTERLHLSVPSGLHAGRARVHASFRGVLNDRLRGFYRSTYTDADGRDHTIATTQFQSTDARRAFPCWDEPAWKATFATTLIVDPGHLAVSNGATIGDIVEPDGRRRVTFAETMRMSTYLVAFVVGPLEFTDPVDAGGVPVRVVHRPGQGHLTSFALDVAVHALEWFAEYYDIPYPGDKVDLLAIPDFAFGAMENLGCITFREVLLLVDPEGASQPELQGVADVINHELAHMWFGDLVTMRWWEGIWLNEAFATFMETSCSHAFRPDWDVWTTFGRARAAAFDTDALATTRPIEFPVVTPEEAEGMFDILTYEKGASVVRMLEQHLGPVVFRDGVRRYLRVHAYANTETSDLWDALEDVSARPVRRIMDGWIFQGGYPVIDAEHTPHGIRLRQRHFTLDPTAADDRMWAVPLGLRLDHKGSIDEHRVLLDTRSVLVTAPGKLVTANADAAGFFRVHPGHHPEPPTGSLDPPERHGIVDDAWAMTLAGEMEAIRWMTLAEGFRTERDLTVWQALSTGLGSLMNLVDDDPAAAGLLSSRIVDLATPTLDSLGVDRRESDDDRTRELRATVIRLLGAVADHQPTISACRDRLDDDDPTLAAAALTVVAHHGDRAVADQLRQRWKSATDPQTEQRHLRARADLPDIDLVGEALDDILRDEVRSQDGPYLIRRALANRAAGESVWRFTMRHWAQLAERFPSNSLARMLEGVTALDRPEMVGVVAEFIADHPVPQGEKQISQHLERQRINAAFRGRESTRFKAAL